jgi:hypothetical protein
MKDILARNPKLDDVIRKAANRLGENHGLTRDNHGAVIDNNGNSSRYVGSNGQHPSQVNKVRNNNIDGWHRTLNEMDDMELEEDCLGEGCGDHEEELGEESPNKALKKIRDRLRKLLGGGKTTDDDGNEDEYVDDEEMEMGEVTGASSAGGYEGPLFGSMTESERILKSVIREEVSKKVSKQQLKESIKNRITRNILMEQEDTELATVMENLPNFPETLYDNRTVWCGVFEGRIPPKLMAELMQELEVMGGGGPSVSNLLKRIDPITFNEIVADIYGPSMETPYIQVDSKEECEEIVKKEMDDSTVMIQEKAFYNDGKFKYEKPTKLPGEIKNMPGMKQTDSTLKKSKSTNTEYLKHFDKKIKDYLNFEGNSNPEFPHQNNSKTDYKSPMYRNTAEDEEFIEDFRGMGLEDANGVDMLDRIDDYLSGSQETGNAQTGKDGKALGNVVPNKVGDRIKKKVKRKKEKIAKQKSKMTNLRGMTPDVQTTSIKESYLLTERPWWKTGLRVLGCCTVLFPILFRCCIDTFRSARIANPPSDFPPLDPGLSREEIKSLKPHENARSWEDLPENIQAILSKAQPKILAYIEEIKAMGGDNPRGKEITMDPRAITPLGPGQPVPMTTVTGTVAEEVNKMKHLFKYTDATQ